MQVENGQTEIAPVIFRAPTPLGLEVMSFDYLDSIARPGHLQRPQRPEFHVLMLIGERQATHTVDFKSYSLMPGDLLWVRAGQVQTFGDEPLPAGQIVLFEPDFLLPGTEAAALADDRFGPTYWQLRDPALPARSALEQLAAAYQATVARPDFGRSEELKHLLSVALLRLADASAADQIGHPPDDTFARLRDAIERDFATHHQVSHYADALGYAPRTLSRAAMSATGSTAKQLIEQRLILEAKRILAHTNSAVSAIAYQLGFDDPSNFSSFFSRHTQRSPTAFRAEIARTADIPRHPLSD